MTRHYSLDIETLGRRPGCVVTQIAITRFDKRGVSVDAESWHLAVEPQMREANASIDPQTLLWWSQQDRALFQEQLTGETRFGTFAQELLSYFVRAEDSSDPDRRIWVCGPDFDAAILYALYDKHCMTAPWKYNNVRDVRTLRKLAKASSAGFEVASLVNVRPHDALSDALQQAKEVIECCKVLGVDLDRL